MEPFVEIPKQQGNFLWELIKFAVLAFIIVAPIRTFIAQPFIVSGASMEPTFENADYLIVDELSYRLGQPAYGDVVIFRYPKDRSKFFIKRIIGLPGDTLKINGSSIVIVNKEHPEGAAFNQSFIAPERQSNDHLSVTLGPNEYYVLGDNRKASSDSRYWGTLPARDLVGRALVRLFPLSSIELLPGKVTPTPSL